MKKHIEPVARLISKFSMLPGVGEKTAARYAYKLISLSEQDIKEFASAMLEAKEKTRYCSVCGNFSVSDTCEICAKRDGSVICVVSEPRDVLSLEKVRDYKGVYHVLHGTISPLEGRGPDDIRIKELLRRTGTGGVKELILATNPDVEGEATAYYIARLMKPFGIKTTRIAQGISMGSDIEYADEATLSRALENRKEI